MCAVFSLSFVTSQKVSKVFRQVHLNEPINNRIKKKLTNTERSSLVHQHSGWISSLVFLFQHFHRQEPPAQWKSSKLLPNYASISYCLAFHVNTPLIKYNKYAQICGSASNYKTKREPLIFVEPTLDFQAFCPSPIEKCEGYLFLWLRLDK